MWGTPIKIGDEVTFRIGRNTLVGTVLSFSEETLEISVPDISCFTLRYIDIMKVK